MSKEGSLKRIEIYKEHGNTKLQKQEEEFFNELYGVSKVEKEEAPKKEKVEKVKKSN